MRLSCQEQWSGLPFSSPYWTGGVSNMCWTRIHFICLVPKPYKCCHFCHYRHRGWIGQLAQADGIVRIWIQVFNSIQSRIWIQCSHANIILYLPHLWLQLCSECWVMTKTEHFNCSRRRSVQYDCVLPKRGNLDAEIARHRRKLMQRHRARRPWEEGRLEWSMLQAKEHQK